MNGPQNCVWTKLKRKNKNIQSNPLMKYLKENMMRFKYQNREEQNRLNRYFI